MKKSEGVKRLAVLSGLLGVIAWLIFNLITLYGFAYGVDTEEIIILFEGIVVCFLTPFIIVHGIYWVRAGFKRDKKVAD